MIEGRTFRTENLDELAALLPGEFADCEFEGLRLAGVSLRGSLFNDCRFRSCHLAGIDLVNGVMRDCAFSSCNLVGLNWASLRRFEGPSFADCKLDLGSFQGCKLPKTKFVDGTALETDFADADLSGAEFARVNLAGAVFSRANLTKADLRTARGYFIEPQFTKLKGAKFSFPEAATLLTAMGLEIDF